MNNWFLAIGIGLLALAFIAAILFARKAAREDREWEEFLAPEAEASPHSRPAIFTLEDQ